MDDRVHAFPVDDCLVLLDERAGTLLLLNSTGSLVWHGLRDGLDEPQIAESLCQQYPISLETARADVEAVLRDWRATELLGDRPQVANSRTDPRPIRGKPLRTAVERNYAVLRARFRVRFGTVVLEERVHPILAHLECEPAGPVLHEIEVYEERGSCVVRCDGAEVARDADPDMAKSLVVAQLVIRSYPEHDLLAALHAAAVSDGRRCVVLPGAPPGLPV